MTRLWVVSGLLHGHVEGEDRAEEFLLSLPQEYWSDGGKQARHPPPSNGKARDVWEVARHGDQTVAVPCLFGTGRSSACTAPSVSLQ